MGGAGLVNPVEPGTVAPLGGASDPACQTTRPGPSSDRTGDADGPLGPRGVTGPRSAFPGPSAARPRARAAHAPLPIARSIAATGDSTGRPWPAASRAGSSARRVRALARAVGRCHVATDASGNHHHPLALVATPPMVV